MSYIALTVAFLMTVVGIAGKTWDPDAKGIRHLTAKGYLVLILALGSLIVSAVDVRKKDLQLRDVSSIRHVANRQVLEGANYLVRHVLAEHVETEDNRKLFAKIQNPANLAAVGQKCLVEDGGGLIGDNYGGIGGFFEQPWQLYDFDVKHGRTLIENVVLRYGAFVEPALIVRINDVLGDEFFVNKFTTLDTSIKPYLELGQAESKVTGSCSGWLTLGLYYFNAVYIPGKERQPDYRQFFVFVEKLRSLVEYASEGNTMNVFPSGSRKATSGNGQSSQNR
jgi:hypothetical protein